MKQSSLFDEPAPAPRVVQETTRKSWEEIVPTLARRERLVLEALHRFVRVQRYEPTAYELFHDMLGRDEVFDLNAVRPRLTSLEKQRLVESTGSRSCRVTGKKAMTWRCTIHPRAVRGI